MLQHKADFQVTCFIILRKHSSTFCTVIWIMGSFYAYLWNPTAGEIYFNYRAVCDIVMYLPHQKFLEREI